MHSLQRLNQKTGRLEPVPGSKFSALDLTERGDIEEWVKANPSVLLPHTGEDLLLIAAEFDGFDKTNERLDVLAMDKAGRLVIIELKRDSSFRTAHMQALGYAAYVSGFEFDDLLSVFTQYARRTGSTATDDELRSVLLEFIEVEFDGAEWEPNPRLIIASRSFRPEVLATCQWLRRQFDMDISCVQMTPYRLGDEILVNVNTVLPLPDENVYRMKRQVPSTADARRALTRSRAPKNEAWWSSENTRASAAFFEVLSALADWLSKQGLSLECNWTAQSYVGYWSGPRCVIAAWPQKAGAALYLPDPSDDGSVDSASTFYTEQSATLIEAGHKVSWAPKYNAMANPIRLVLTPSSVLAPEVSAVLHEALRAFGPAPDSAP